MKKTARILVSLAWFAALSLVTSAPSAPRPENSAPPGPCYLYNGVIICPW